MSIYNCNTPPLAAGILEDDDLVPRLASGRGLPFLLRLAPNRAQLSAEILPGHDRVQDNQRVLLGIETAIALAEIEEPRLTHSCPSRQNQHAALSSKSRTRKRSIFRGALHGREFRANTVNAARRRCPRLDRLQPPVGTCQEPARCSPWQPR